MHSRVLSHFGRALLRNNSDPSASSVLKIEDARKPARASYLKRRGDARTVRAKLAKSRRNAKKEEKEQASQQEPASLVLKTKGARKASRKASPAKGRRNAKTKEKEQASQQEPASLVLKTNKGARKASPAKGRRNAKKKEKEQASQQEPGGACIVPDGSSMAFALTAVNIGLLQDQLQQTQPAVYDLDSDGGSTVLYPAAAITGYDADTMVYSEYSAADIVVEPVQDARLCSYDDATVVFDGGDYTYDLRRHRVSACNIWF